MVGDHAIPQQGANNLDAVAHPLDGLAVGEAVLRPHLHAVARSQAQNKTLVGEMVHRGRRHGNRRGTADKDAANTGPQQNAGGDHGTGGQDSKLIAAMPLGYPGRLVAEVFRKLDTLHNLSG